MAASAKSPRAALDAPEAFEAFYRRHNTGLFRFMLRRVFEPQTALDLTAETFAQAYLARRRCRATNEVERDAWLYGIARRQLARYYRRGGAERRAVTRLAIEVPRLTEEEIFEAQRLADLDGLRASVRSALSELSAEHREALQLRIIEERPYAEIADRIGISEQSVRARVSRGLRALARALDQENRPQEALT